MESGGQSRGSASLDRGLSYQTRGGQAITLSQRGKKDSLHFTLGVSDTVSSLIPHFIMLLCPCHRYCNVV